MKNSKKGFTLVELVIVVAVMAVLVAVAIPTVSSITGSAKDSVEKTNARTIESVIKLAEAEASKNSNGVAELGADAIDECLTKAKLGIEEGTFVYDSETGVVSVGGTASGTKQFSIVFNSKAAATADVIKVTAGATSTNTETP